MAWEDRIKQAAYTSPSGVRITFDYEDVSKSVTKKTAAFEFPDADGTYIQDLGVSGRRYPLRVFFWGANYDLKAIAFEAALLERGIGKLEHPIYGAVNVVPFGEITQRDDLKTAANQAVLEIVFWATIGIVYPSTQSDFNSDTLSALAAFNAAQAAEFSNNLSPVGALRGAVLAQKYNAFLKVTKSGLRSIADAQTNVQRQFDSITDSINRGIDILVRDPLTLAFQTSIMIQAPARALTSIKARLEAYANLAQSIFTSQDSAPLDNDELRTRDLFALSYISGSVLSAINNAFTTRAEALTTAENILDQLDTAIAWREFAIADAGEVDTGGAYQAIQDSAASVAAYLIELSFSLKQERRITLDRNRTIIDLCAEVYGGIDDFLDFLIDSNNLSGSEILELPRGRTIAYYV